MANNWQMDSMLLISNTYINWCPLFKFLDQAYLIHICKCTLTWYLPRCPLQSHSLVHSKNNSYFFGIGPICDADLTCIFWPFFPFVRCIEDRSQYYNINFEYTSIFKCCYHDIELCFVPYFGAEFGKMFILKVYIYLPCINTQLQETAPFDDTHVISSSDHQQTGLYQGSDKGCEGYRNYDLICLLQQSQAIHYCNQLVLAIVPDLNIFVFDIRLLISFREAP